MIELQIVGNIGGLIRSVEKLQSSLGLKMMELVRRLMEEGYKVASYAYSAAVYAGDLSYDLTITADGNKMYLYASGDSIAFIEFGSGKIFEDYPTDMPGDGGSPYETLHLDARGEFGKKQGADPPWIYVGDPGNLGTVIAEKKNGSKVVRTSGNPPARGMYEAAVTIANESLAVEIAKEVFNK